MRKDLAKQLKETRDRVGYSQADVAKLLEVALRTYQSWEQGTRNPCAPAAKLLKLFVQEHQPKRSRRRERVLA